MKNRLFCLLVVLVCALMAAGCGRDAQSAQQDTGTVSLELGEDNPAPEEEPEKKNLPQVNSWKRSAPTVRPNRRRRQQRRKHSKNRPPNSRPPKPSSRQRSLLSRPRRR